MARNPKTVLEPRDTLPQYGERIRYSMSLVTQGSHRFYSLTMFTDVLAGCCFATSREEDPIEGFQRVLNVQRAQEIADYMDLGFGTIPSSIILSAQLSADLKDVGGGKTIEFTYTPHSFLILDGQHRVFGFSRAKTKLRVPVIIYNDLTKQQESKLFIDINTKQKPVPNELLLDIKKLADAENDEEALLGELFDAFNNDGGSPLVGLLSSSTRARGKLSRVSFYAAVKPVLPTFVTPSTSLIYPALQGYLCAFYKGLATLGVRQALVNPTVFRAIFDVFPEIAQRVVDRYGPSFKEEGFSEVMSTMFIRMKASKLERPPRSYKELSGDFSKALRGGFVIG